MATVVAWAVAVGGFSALGMPRTAPASPVPAVSAGGRDCDVFRVPPRAVGVVPGPLHELSGLVASRLHPGVFWAHNDSGNSFEIFAIRENGTVVARIPLRGGSPRDVEDIAAAPCARGSAQSCLYLADTGDNWQRREQSRLYRLPEPTPLDDVTPREVETLPFRYSDGARNAEALLVDPRTAEAFVVTKRPDSLGDIYRIDGLRPGDVGVAIPIGAIRATAQRDALTTAGDVSPSGERVLLRTYRRVFELRLPGALGLEEILLSTPHEVPHASQPQGEAIAWLPRGRGYLFAGEGEGSPIHRTECAP